MALRKAPFVYEVGAPKKTSIGGRDSRIKRSSMNKSKRRSYKRYRGQGR